MEENEIKEKIYSTFANIANSLGYSEVYGRIIACLLINGGAVSLNDISKETGYSPSMVSLSVDFLETIGMIKRVKKPGDKKLYLQSTGTLLDGLKKVILMRIEKNVSNSLQQFDEYRKEIKKLRNKESEKLLKAVEILEKEIKRMNDYINILSKIQLS
jgi:DNA-binding transcriptional regulator GbsR (MarR family)